MGRRFEKEIAANPDLDIFSLPLIQTSIIGEQVIDVYPIAPVTKGQAIQFDTPATYSQMTDPNITIYVEVKIINADGTKLVKDAEVSPTNLLLHAMFRDVILKINDIVVSQATGAYPFRAYMETNFTYSSAGKQGAIGIPQMYYQETGGKFQSIDPKTNPSYGDRKSKFVESKLVKMTGRLLCDFLNMQKKLLVPGLRISLSVIPASDNFTIFHSGAGDFKLHIEQISLRIRRVNLTPGTLLAIEKGLQEKPAKYPIFRSTIRTTQLLTGQTHLSNFIVYNGQLPRLVIITTISSTAFDGNFAENPFNFSWENCRYAGMEANGRQYPPLPYRPHTNTIEPYLNSLKLVNKLYSDTSAGLTLDDFEKEGHQILVFDLSPDDAGTINHFSPKQNAVLTLNATWGQTDLIKPTTLIIYLQWDNTITVDSRKNLILDYVA